MADTRALRQKIERRIAELQENIAELQEKLKAVDAVEAMERDLGEAPRSLPLPFQPPAPNASSAPVAADGSFPDICAQFLTDEWSDLDYFVPLVQRVRPDATRQNVSVGLRRLAERGLAEVKTGGSRREGNEYRRKQAA